MYVKNNTANNHDNITDYDNFTNHCTNNENKFDIIKLTLLLTVPCGLSFLCLMVVMVYTLIEPLKTFK